MEKELTREEKIKLVKQDITKTHIMKMFEELVNELPEITEDDITSGDYVDLGLPSGLKWATCNVGATKPCEYGLLYQFGRVDGYAYGDKNNQFRTTTQNKADTGSMLTPKTTSGKKYDIGNILNPEDDAAYVASNGDMRTPTYNEYQELLDNTTNEWVSCSVMGGDHTSHNVMGRLFTSKTDSSKKLFLPAAGCFGLLNGTKGSFINSGSLGEYWSSSAHDSYSGCGWNFIFHQGEFYFHNEYKCYGNSVRGVRNK